MQHILAPTGTEDVPPFYYQSVLCFWDQTFGGKGTEKFILENKKFLFYFYLQDRFSCLPFFTSHILWNKLSVSSGSQSPSLGMWSFLIPVLPCWSDFSFQSWQNVFPSLDGQVWQHPIKLHLFATCPVNVVTDGSFLLEQSRRPGSPRMWHRWLQPQRTAPRADKTLNHQHTPQSSDSHQLWLHSCQQRMWTLFHTFHSRCLSTKLQTKGTFRVSFHQET